MLKKLLITFLITSNFSFSLLMYISDYKIDILKDKKVMLNHGKIVEGVDFNTFQKIGEACAKDKNNVYFGNDIIESADPITFEKIYSVTLSFNGSLYYKDKNNVYFAEVNELVKIENADPDTFIVYDSITAGDKNNKYFRATSLKDKQTIDSWDKRVELIKAGNVFP